MAPRLKVFVTSDGLTDYVVATTSKPKALAAWGSHQDLFKTGLAHETDDPELAKSAIARPGEVLRRPAGTRGTLANLKPARKAATTAAAAKPTPAKPRGPSKAALRKVAELEKKLAALDRTHATAVRKLEAQRTALAQRAEAMQAQHAEERTRWERALSAARQALG
jgi:hypothetical protein